MRYSEFLFSQTNGKRFSQEESYSCYSQSQVVYTYHILILSLQGFARPKYHFGSLGPDMKVEVGVVI